MPLPSTIPEEKIPADPVDVDPYRPHYMTEEEIRKMKEKRFFESPEGKKFREQVNKAAGPSQQQQQDTWLESELRRIQEETDKRTRELEGELWRQAKGEETPAQKQFAEQLQQTRRLAAGTVGSVRGVSGERARRYSQDFGSRLETEGRPRLASLRATEMQDAEEALARFQAQRDALALQYLGMEYSAEDAKRMADLEYQNMIQAFKDQRLAEYRQMKERQMGLVSSVTGTIGRIAAMISDENTKQDIREVNPKEIDEFLRALKGYKYEYKDEFKKHPLANDSKNTGLMAQDLEKSSIGKTIVKEIDINGRKTKSVDNGRLLHALTVAVADMNNRLNSKTLRGA